MRLALVIAPSDSRSGDAGLRREALAWLRGRLARFGFHVVIVGGVQDPEADIARAIARVSEGDTVLVHASGRLSGRDSIAFGETGLIALSSLTEALAERSPAHVSFVLELTHDEDENDALLAAEILGAAMHELGAKARGYPVLAAVRPIAMQVDRVAFTRLALPVVSEHAGPPATEALVASMYEAASATDESHAVAQSFTFSRGGLSVPPPPPTAFKQVSAVYDRAPPTEFAESDALREAVLEALGEHTQPESVADAHAEPSIHSLIAEATELRDWTRALDLRRHRLHLLSSPRQKSKELVAIARILQAEFGDSEGAIGALEMARAMDPERATVLQALRRGYEKLRRWGNVLEVTAALAALAPSLDERAKLQVACGYLAFERLSDRDRAIAWLEAALASDPTNPDAVAALAHLCPAPAVEAAPAPTYAAAPEYAPALAYVPAPAPAYAGAPTYAPAPEYAPALAPDLAPAFEPARAPAPSFTGESESATREAMADRFFAAGADEAALAELESVAEHDPMRVSLYERSFAAHRRSGRTEAALLAAFALEELGAAGVDEQVLIDQFRSVAPTRVRTSLDAAAWAALRAPGSDEVLSALFAAVEGAAIAARVDELREQRTLVSLDPAARLSDTSTATIVRSFQWAARVLSVDCPHLYVRDVPGGIAAIPAREPSTGLGGSVVSGRSAKDLAFLAGRHLTYHRPGYQVLFYFGTREELTTLLLAAAQLAMPKAAGPSRDPAVRALRARLARHIEPAQHAALDRAVRALDARGGQASLGAWMASVEKTANRAGLLLAGDLATATGMLRLEAGPVAHLPMETLRGDLVAFCASRAHATMRTRFAMTAPESVLPSPLPPPPPPSSSSLQFAP